MEILKPDTPEALAEALAASAGRGVRLGGAFTKEWMGGPLAPAGLTVSTRALDRLRTYDPADLTISVEAGLPWSRLTRLLAEHRQMIPLDPPFAAEATVGGVVASNSNGPRRRLYGTARDAIIGMKFATLDGKLVETGGMVVKNVAGLDIAKVMVGSFGTLAALAVVNFKVQPMPVATRTFVLEFASAAQACAARDTVLRGYLQPAAVDLLNPEAAAHAGRQGWTVLVQAAGNPAVIGRYARELDGAAQIDGEVEEALWTAVREFTPRFLAASPEGAVVRVSSTLTGLGAVLETAAGPAVARAGSGVAYLCFDHWRAAGQWAEQAPARGWKCVVEFAPPEHKSEMTLWPAPGGDLDVMKQIKRMFDPGDLLNRSRLYGRI